jgi:phage baseplate assembly protein gpV
MSGFGDIVDLLHREFERHSAGKHNKRIGKVTSWDPVKHLAKVMFQPEAHETGWLPVHTMAAGSGFGHMTGLTPGDGKTTGDQVEVVYQEGDFDTGAIVARIHSKMNPPPTVQSGEQLFMTPFMSSVKLANDGSITLTDKAGSVVKQDGTGQITVMPASGKNVFLGGNGTTGTYKLVLCVGNVPALNVLARVS